MALEHRGLKLDAVLELEVDEAALVSRIEKRAAETWRPAAPSAPTTGRMSCKRLEAYAEQTAPVSAYYADAGRLKRIDGMAPIDDVSAAIDRALGTGDPAVAVAAQ